MRVLQNLWSKRCSTDAPPLICRSTGNPQQDLHDPDDASEERSFFETDSDSEEEEEELLSPKRLE